MDYSNKMNHEVAFEQGKESAKLKTHKQGLVTGSLQGLVLSSAIFNEFSILVKLIIFVILQLILGAVMSSWSMKQKRLEERRKIPRKIAEELVKNLNKNVLADNNAEVLAQGIRESKDR